MRHVLYGMKRRVEDATLVHEHSSRSHLIITLTITASLRQVSAVPLTALNRSVVLPDLQLTPPSSPSRGGTHLKRSVRHVSSTSSPSLSCTSSFSDFSAVSNGAVGTPGGEGSVFRTKLQLVDLAGSECVGKVWIRVAAFVDTVLLNGCVWVRNVRCDWNGIEGIITHQPEFVCFS